MALHPRLMHSLLVVACVCAASPASPSAHSQTAAMPQEQEALPAPQPHADEQLGFGDNTAQRRDGYSGFLIQMAGEERHIQQDLEQGRTTSRWQVNWAKLLGIREDEEQAMRTLAADSQRSIKEIEEQGWADYMELRQDPSKENAARLYAHGKELGRKRTEILDETIEKLRQELGKEGFKSLDAYVYRTSAWKGVANTAIPSAIGPKNFVQPGTIPPLAQANEPQP